MLYVAIDQLAKQITVCVRNEDRDTVLRRHVSTRPEKIQAFFQRLTEMDTEFMAVLEVCGFNDWSVGDLRNVVEPNGNHFNVESGTVFFEHAGNAATSAAWDSTQRNQVQGNRSYT